MALTPDPSFDPIAGKPALADRIQKLRVSYLLLEQRADFVRNTFGEAALEAVAERLDPEARRYFTEKPETFSWYPVAPLMEVDRAILEGPLGGMPRRLAEMGSYNARRHLRGVLRAFLWMSGNPGAIIRRMPAVIPKYYEGATATILHNEGGQARWRMEGAVFPYHYCHQLVPGWGTEGLGLAGGKEARLVHASCVHHGDPHCEWEAVWR